MRLQPHGSGGMGPREETEVFGLSSDAKNFWSNPVISFVPASLEKIQMNYLPLDGE